MANTEEVKIILKDWIALDDENRTILTRQKAIREAKAGLSAKILAFMRDNEVDNFNLEGSGSGTISRSTRTSRPPLKRANIRTQLLLQFADHPQRVAEALRAIEGIAEGDDMSVGGVQRELLSRRVPKKSVII